MIRKLKNSKTIKRSNSKESSLEGEKFEAERNIELYQVLLSAGLDLQTLKSMMDHKKKTSHIMKENNRKLVNKFIIN